MPVSCSSFWFALSGTLCCQHAVDEGQELVFVSEVRRSTGSEVLDASPMTDLGCPRVRLQLDDKGPVGGQRYVFLGHGGHARSVPRWSRSREAGRAFHLRWQVFDLRRWAFAPRSRSVVAGRVNHRQLGLRRAEVGGVVAFGETAHDLTEQLVCVG